MMDATNDVVVSVVKDYEWEALRVYATSLARSGFRGTKLMFIQNISVVARQELLKLGFTLVDYTFHDPDRGFGTVRFQPVIEYLTAHHNFRYVIWTDMRDSVFQSDPSPWLETNLSPHRLLAASECVVIRNEYYNLQWIRQAFSPEICTWLQDYEVCNSGCFAGDADTMLGVFSKIYEISLQSTEASGAYLDQGMFNYVLRISPFKEVTRILKAEEFFASCNFFLIPSQFTGVKTNAPSPVLDHSTGLMYPASKSEPFAIVHQYDRDPVWKTIVENRYKG
jgi:hypothetical protein